MKLVRFHDQGAMRVGVIEGEDVIARANSPARRPVL